LAYRSSSILSVVRINKPCYEYDKHQIKHHYMSLLMPSNLFIVLGGMS